MISPITQYWYTSIRLRPDDEVAFISHFDLFSGDWYCNRYTFDGLFRDTVMLSIFLLDETDAMLAKLTFADLDVTEMNAGLPIGRWPPKKVVDRTY